MDTSQPPAHITGATHHQHNHPGKTKGTLGDNQDNTIIRLHHGTTRKLHAAWASGDNALLHEEHPMEATGPLLRGWLPLSF